MRVIVLIGAPGAGKGTQAGVLAEQLGLPHVASGDIFRAAIREGTALGLEASTYIDRGALVPDEVTLGVISARLSRPAARAGAILDGFPRTRAQAEAFDRALAGRGNRVERALYIEVGEEELVRRLAGRRICRSAGHVYHETAKPPRRPGRCDIDGSQLEQRDDDRPETVRARLAAQLAPMLDVVDHYRGRDVLAVVDGDRSIDEVGRALLRALGTAPTAR